MTRKIKSGALALVLGLTVCFGALAQMPVPAAETASPDDPMLQLQKLNQFYRYLNGTYVDTVHNDALVEKAIREMLLQLDPHSTYLTAEEMKGVKEVFDGSFSGIGIEFNVLSDTVIVVNVIAGGPSEKVGLLPNDRIVKADGKNIVGTKQLDVPKILRGPKGTRVDLEVVRHGEKAPLEFSIIRDNIPINTIDAAYKVDPSTGYIRVNRFANNTYKEFLEAYQKLGPLDALILDLRSNGGGLLDQAIDLSNFFLPAGSLIVSTEGLRVPPGEARATADGPFTTGKVIVLTNETSASGSEIVAGALQDWDRALVLGRRTFGTRPVQRQFPLVDGSAIRLTVARYHTPTGRVIQRPFKNGDLEGYEMDFINRFGETGDTTRVDSSEMFRTLRSGRTVFGGGGITPDIVVPLDTSDYTKYWGSLVRQGVINEFVIEYLDENRPALSSRYAAPEKFVSDFTVSDDVLDALTAKATKKGIAFDAAEFERSKKALKTQLKALIAQKMWGVNEYYLVVNGEDDPVFAKALEVLKNWNQYGDSTGTVLPQKP